MLTSNKHALPFFLVLAACGQADPTPEPDLIDSSTPNATEPVVNLAPAPEDDRLVTAFQAAGRGDFQTCRKLAEQVLLDFPRHPGAEFLLALGLQKSKRYAEALPLFQSSDTAKADFPGKQAVPYYRAWCEYWLGDFKAARLDFKRHLETNNEGDSHFGLGAIALELGDYKEARTELQRALEIFEAKTAQSPASFTPELAKTHARLADVELAEDNNEAARDHLEAALKLDSTKPAVWFKLYTVAVDMDDTEIAALAKAEYERLSPPLNRASSMIHGEGR